jgi:hypothetical protein
VNDDVGDNGDVIPEDNNRCDVFARTLTRTSIRNYMWAHIPYILFLHFF